jgi:dTDP-4-amino-4,6-dideoxygalactose transaminase
MVSIYELQLRSIVADGPDRARRLPDDWMLFDSGRSALYFFLQHLKETAALRSVAVNAYTTDVVHRTIRALDLDVVPLDIDPKTFCPYLPGHIELRNSVTIQTGLFGFRSYDDGLPRRIKEAGGIFLEDCCNSYGTQIHGKEAGSFGDAAFFSFRVGKPLSSSGGSLKINRGDLTEGIRERYNRVVARSSSEEKARILRTYLDYVVFAPLVLRYVSRPLRHLEQHVPLLRGLVKGGVVDTLSDVDASTLRRMTPSEVRFATRRLSWWVKEQATKKAVSDTLREMLRGYPLYVYANNPQAAEGWNHLFFPVLLETGDPERFVTFLRRSGFDASRFHGHVPRLSFPQLSRNDYPGTFTLIEKLVCIPNTTRMLGNERRLADAVDRFFSAGVTP